MLASREARLREIKILINLMREEKSCTDKELLEIILTKVNGLPEDKIKSFIELERHNYQGSKYEINMIEDDLKVLEKCGISADPRVN